MKSAQNFFGGIFHVSMDEREQTQPNQKDNGAFGEFKHRHRAQTKMMMTSSFVLHGFRWTAIPVLVWRYDHNGFDHSAGKLLHGGFKLLESNQSSNGRANTVATALNNLSTATGL